MQSFVRFYVVFSIILAVAMQTVVLGQRSQLKAKKTVSLMTERGSYRKSSDLTWMKAPWEKSDSKFLQIRREIMFEVEREASPSETVRKYKKMADETPLDPELQYKLFIAIFHTSNMGSRELDPADLSDLSRRFCLAKSPKCREWSRANFLIEYYLNRFRNELLPLSKRLHESDSNDAFLFRAYAFLTGCSKKYAESISIYEEFIRRFPRKKSVYSDMAYFKERLAGQMKNKGNMTESKKFYLEAIECYKKCPRENSGEISEKYKMQIQGVRETMKMYNL